MRLYSHDPAIPCALD